MTRPILKFVARLVLVALPAVGVGCGHCDALQFGTLALTVSGAAGPPQTLRGRVEPLKLEGTKLSHSGGGDGVVDCACSGGSCTSSEGSSIRCEAPGTLAVWVVRPNLLHVELEDPTTGESIDEVVALHETGDHEGSCHAIFDFAPVALTLGAE